ncbi:MAG: cytochrome c [Chloroflexi bacterium]|nr:cytochrome c [Chloroflexota bacterium]
MGVALSFAFTILLVAALSAACGSQPLVAEKAAPTATDVSAAIVARGAQLYATNCQACHGDKNGVGRLPYAPSHGNDGHTWHHSDRNLIDIIMNGGDEMTTMMRSMSGVPEDAPRMPAWKGKLSEEEVRAILAYIKTFWTPERRRMQERSPMMP